MNTTTFIIVGAVFIAALLGSIIANIFIKRKSGKDILADDSLEDKISRISSQALRNNTDQFLSLAKEVLGSQKNEIKIDLEGKKSAINELISEIRRDIRKNEERLARSDEERISSFSSLKKELENYKEVTGDLKVSADRLKNLLSNNQMRGAFGEQIAENLMRMAGLVIGQDYLKNEKQQTENTRPDFTILLPDNTKINIDVKFPYASLVKSIESEDATEKKKHFLSFKQDVKNKIKQAYKKEIAR